MTSSPLVVEPDEVEILPTRVRYPPDEPVGIEIRGPVRAPAALTVWRLGELVTGVDVDGAGVVSVGTLPEGGYGVELDSGGTRHRSAVLVTGDDRARLRYGFVASYAPDKDVDAVSDQVRRLHLDAVQLYDWAYRHADLLGGGELYDDPLGQPISLATVRRLTGALHDVGADALGYAAVYAVGAQEWPRWRHRALLQSDGQPYGLGDFLWLVDPAAADWQEHLVADLRRAVELVGLDGFHLDQYGYPRRAVTVDGEPADLARAFPALIAAVRAGLPVERLVFNNVNDFPTWTTGPTAQDALYIEVWTPHTTLGSLAAVVTRARAAGPGKPVVIAAYQHVYDEAPARAADLATSFTMATLYSHGATQLLAGESGHVLVDPYYVRNHAAEPSTLDLLRRWYDFLVEHDRLLLAADAVATTGSWVGVLNEALDVAYPEVPVSEEPQAGAVWRRVVEVDGRLVVHLINLVGQADTAWDAPRAEPGATGGGTLRVRRTGSWLPRVRVADPDGRPRLVDLEVQADGEFAVAELPAVHVWQLVVVDLEGTR